jgi:membrane-associated phospholipid phosphatase
MKTRRWAVLVCVVAVAAVLGTRPLHSASPCGTDLVCNWNELALKTARLAPNPAPQASGLNDARAARLYAMVNAAMYDAVNGILSQHGGHEGSHGAREGRGYALVPPDGAKPRGNPGVAAAAAAHTVLAGEFAAFAGGFPDLTPGYDAQLQSDRADGGVGQGSAGEKWGAYVGNQVRALRAADIETVSQSAVAPAPGVYNAAWSGINLAPFAVAYPIGLGPAPRGSLDYAAAFAEVKLLGNAGIIDDAKLATFRFWSLGNPTSQPPGAWIQVALTVTGDLAIELADKTRLLALLTIAMADTVRPTTLTKVAHRHWRPTLAIQQAATDGNPYTEPESWTQRGTAATSPENWSGHSAFGGAGAAVLAGFFCNDDILVTIQTDSAVLNGLPARSYASFSAVGAEMGQSRVVGGLHFPFSNQQGLAAGRAIAAKVLAEKLLRRDRPTHFGACPR